MKTKALVLALTVALATTAFVGCGKKAEPAAAQKPAATAPAAEKKADATTGASIANDEAAFEQKISKANTNFMVITTKDLTFTKDLTLESGVKKGTDGKETVTRSLGLGTYKEDKSVDKRFKITVPNLIVTGENAKMEYGVIKGDVYVQAKGFSIKDGTIDGNLYFANEELKNAFKLDATSKVTGKTEVKAK